MSSAVVFGYHDVGVRCLAVLLARGVDVKLVVTHEDDLAEKVWFESVAELAARHDVPIATPETPDDAKLASRVADLAPDLIFSFYYRRMIPTSVLRLARRGAFNMHGSLLPRYRGRSPVNWAIVNGEKETGVTLHEMTARADQGAIAGCEAVTILPNDTALDLFRKITPAAERLLDRVLPSLLDGSVDLVPQDESLATKFGGRKPADGLIDWRESASVVHNLVRSVAPPFPGAFTTLRGETVFVHRTLRAPTAAHRSSPLHLYGDGGRCYAVCGDGRTLRLVEACCSGRPLDLAAYAGALAEQPLPLIAS